MFAFLATKDQTGCFQYKHWIKFGTMPVFGRTDNSNSNLVMKKLIHFFFVEALLFRFFSHKIVPLYGLKMNHGLDFFLLSVRNYSFQYTGKNIFMTFFFTRHMVHVGIVILQPLCTPNGAVFTQTERFQRFNWLNECHKRKQLT